MACAIFLPPRSSTDHQLSAYSFSSFALRFVSATIGTYTFLHGGGGMPSDSSADTGRSLGPFLPFAVPGATAPGANRTTNGPSFVGSVISAQSPANSRATLSNARACRGLISDQPTQRPGNCNYFGGGFQSKWASGTSLSAFGALPLSTSRTYASCASTARS